MLRFRRHFFRNRRGRGRKNGLRQIGFHAEGIARLHRFVGRVVPDAPARMCSPAKAEHSVSPHCRDTQWSGAMSRVDQAEAAVKFMEDHTHEERLDKILWAARMRRDQAALQVPEWEELRDLASQIKEHTLSNLAQ